MKMEFEITPDGRLCTLEERLQDARWRAGYSILTGNAEDSTQYIGEVVALERINAEMTGRAYKDEAPEVLVRRLASHAEEIIIAADSVCAYCCGAVRHAE